MTRSLCVVGAGAAGAAATHALREADVAVTVLEKSRGVCGRAATRRRDGRRYDYGAGLLDVRGDRVAALVEALGADGRIELEAPIWRLDGGRVVEDDPDPPRRVAWERGMTQLAKRAFAATDATVERETRVVAMDRDERGWRVTDDDGASHGPFDALLLTPPAPQTASLLAATGWSSERAVRLRETVGGVGYEASRTVVLGYDRPFDRPWLGLRGDDDLRWVGRESAKPGHVPEGEEILVVQTGDRLARDREDETADGVARTVATRVAELLGTPWLADPAWTDDQFWRYARPINTPPVDLLGAGEDDGLYVAGDWVAGEGRVDAALRSGLDAADRLR